MGVYRNACKPYQVKSGWAEKLEIQMTTIEKIENVRQSSNINTPLRLDHLAIWVEDMGKTVSFLTDIVGLKRHPMVVEVSEDDPTCGGMEAVFVDGNGLWLEMILPTTPGPGMDMLKEYGDGAIVEVNFEAVDDDYMNIINDMTSKGVQMLSMDGSPLKDGGKIDEGVRGLDDTHETGQRIAYWPTAVSCGTTIEVYEKMLADETNLLNVRNQMWKGEKTDPNSPRIDHVSILVEDLEKTASFYTEIMELSRHPIMFENEAGVSDEGTFKSVFIDANGVWVQLVQPTSSGYLMNLLKEKGDGYAMEVALEVEDLDKFYDQMQDKGITMVNLNGSSLELGTKGASLMPYGDRYHYFPLCVSRGLRVMVYERGPRVTSMLHRRDDALVTQL